MRRTPGHFARVTRIAAADCVTGHLSTACRDTRAAPKWPEEAARRHDEALAMLFR